MLVPIAILVVQFVVTVLVVAFTPRASFLRVAILPLMAFATWESAQISSQHMRRGPWAAMTGGYSVTFLFQYLSVAIFRGHEFDMRNSLGNTYSNRLKFGLRTASTFRSPNMKGLPAFSAKNRDYVPSRMTFLRSTLTTIFVCWLVLDTMGLAADADANAKNFAPQRIPFFSRLSEVTAEEIIVRVFATFATGLGIYCSQEGLQSLFALTAFGLGISEVSAWRPRFGSLYDAYSLRRFWSHTWHQVNRGIVSDPTAFIIHDLLRLRRGTVESRYAALITHFFISGLLHTVIDVASGIPLTDSGATRFFCTQVIGIILEDLVRAIFSSSERNPSTAKIPATWNRYIGYLWVAIFLTWSIPVWLYPMLFRTRSGMEDSVLPFSPLRLIFNIV